MPFDTNPIFLARCTTRERNFGFRSNLSYRVSRGELRHWLIFPALKSLKGCRIELCHPNKFQSATSTRFNSGVSISSILLRDYSSSICRNVSILMWRIRLERYYCRLSIKYEKIMRQSTKQRREVSRSNNSFGLRDAQRSESRCCARSSSFRHRQLRGNNFYVPANKNVSST